MAELGKNMIDTIDNTRKNNLLAEISDTVHTELREFSGKFNKYEDGYNYLGGDQIDKGVKEWFISQDRPAKVYNLLLPRFNSIFGDFLLSRQRRRVFALPGGNAKMATLRQKMLDQLYNRDEVRWEMTATAMAGLLHGGFAQASVENLRNIEGEVHCRNRNEFEILYDSRCLHPMLDDAAYMIRFRKISPVDIKNMWREHKTKLGELFGIREKRDENVDWLSQLGPREQQFAVNKVFFDRANGKYLVVEFHKWVWEEATVFTDLLTGITEVVPPGLPKDRLDQFLKLHPVHRLSERVIKMKEITTIVPGIWFMLEHYRPALQDDTFDIQKFSFYPYGKRAIDDFGLFENTRDILDGHNENKNNESTVMKRGASPGFKFKPTALENPEDMELYSSKPDINLAVKQGFRLDEAVKQNDPPPNLQAMKNLVQEDVELLDRVMGVSANFGGQTQTKQENASLFAQRVQQTQQTFQIGYSQYARFQQRMDNKCLKLMQLYYTTERTVVITSPGLQEPETFILNMKTANGVVNDFAKGEYQSIVDEQNATPTMRLVRFQLKSEIIDKLVVLFGEGIGAAIPMDWWLGEAIDVGDVQPLIDGINGFIGNQADAAQKAGAMLEVQELLAAAQQQLDLKAKAKEIQAPVQVAQQ